MKICGHLTRATSDILAICVLAVSDKHNDGLAACPGFTLEQCKCLLKTLPTNITVQG